MGSRSGTALVVSLNLMFLLTSVSCRPQKHHIKHHKIVHSHPVVINSTGVRPLDDSNCPRDALKMGVCVNLLGDLLNVEAGIPPQHPCCSAMFGVMDMEAAICLCTTIRGSFLGITIEMPIRMTLLLNFCGRPVPKGFICA